jgi:hypothetical protein
MLAVRSVTVRYACVDFRLDIFLYGLLNICTCMCKRAHEQLKLFSAVFLLPSPKSHICVSHCTRGNTVMHKDVHFQWGLVRCGDENFNIHVATHEAIILSLRKRCFLHWFLVFGFAETMLSAYI